jgi:predicted kinase
VEAQDLEQRAFDAYRSQERRDDRLSLTLVGGFAGSGKSEFARFLSGVTGWTILDKDTMTRALVEQLLLALGCDSNDRHSETYLTKVRPHEYRVLLDQAFENLDCGSSTILTAPFLREFADEAWLRRVQNKCRMLNAVFTVVWLKCDADSMYDYVRFRGASRDAWKLANWDDYLSGINPDFEPNFPHCTVDNRLNAAVALAEQARNIARQVNRA